MYYPDSCFSSPRRTPEEIKQQAQEVETMQQCGVAGVSAFHLLEDTGFDIMEGFALDGMHYIFLGFFKKLFEWITSKKTS